jgi:hypothetical protein
MFYSMKNINNIDNKRTFDFLTYDFLSTLIFLIQYHFFESAVFASLDDPYFIDFTKLAFRYLLNKLEFEYSILF